MGKILMNLSSKKCLESQKWLLKKKSHICFFLWYLKNWDPNDLATLRIHQRSRQRSQRTVRTVGVLGCQNQSWHREGLASGWHSGDSWMYPYNTWVFMAYYPQESLYFRPISTMGTLLGVHPIVPWGMGLRIPRCDFEMENITTDVFTDPWKRYHHAWWVDGKMVGKIQLSYCHREIVGTLGMVPLIINPIYTLYTGYLLGFIGYIPF